MGAPLASPAQGASWLLTQRGVGTTGTPTGSEWLIRIGWMPDQPDEIIALYDSGGFNPNTKWLLDFVTVQAIIRGSVHGYPTAYAKAQAVKDALLGLDPQAIGDGADQVWWSGVTMLADIAFVKNDDKNRPLFSINFRILQERPPNALTNRQALDDPGP